MVDAESLYNLEMFTSIDASYRKLLSVGEFHDWIGKIRQNGEDCDRDQGKREIRSDAANKGGRHRDACY